MPTPTGGTVCHISLSPEIYTKLQHLAWQEGITVPALMRRTAIAYARNHEAAKPEAIEVPAKPRQELF